MPPGERQGARATKTVKIHETQRGGVLFGVLCGPVASVRNDLMGDFWPRSPLWGMRPGKTHTSRAVGRRVVVAKAARVEVGGCFVGIQGGGRNFWEDQVPNDTQKSKKK